MFRNSIDAEAALASSQTRVRHLGPGPARKPYTDLFFVSFAILFLELACIRWFGSAVLFLTFFTNIVLFACFLGMSVGLLATSRRFNIVTWVIPLAIVAVGLAELTSWACTRLGNVAIDVGGQASPQQVFFGTEYCARRPEPVRCADRVHRGGVLRTNRPDVCGARPGDGPRLSAAPNRVTAYSVDIRR